MNEGINKDKNIINNVITKEENNETIKDIMNDIEIIIQGNDEQKEEIYDKNISEKEEQLKIKENNDKYEKEIDNNIQENEIINQEVNNNENINEEKEIKGNIEIKAENKEKIEEIKEENIKIEEGNLIQDIEIQKTEESNKDGEKNNIKQENNEDNQAKNENFLNEENINEIKEITNNINLNENKEITIDDDNNNIDPKKDEMIINDYNEIKDNNSYINQQINEINKYENRILLFDSYIQNLNNSKYFMKERDKSSTYKGIKTYNTTKTQIKIQDKIFKEDKKINKENSIKLNHSFIQSDKTKKNQIKEISYLLQKPKTPIKHMNYNSSQTISPNSTNSKNILHNYDTYNLFIKDNKEINQKDLKMLFRKDIPKPKKRKTVQIPHNDKFKTDKKPKNKNLIKPINNDNIVFNKRLFQSELIHLTEFETDSEYIYSINSRKIQYKKCKKMNDVSELNKEQLSEINALIEKENIKEIKNKRATSERRNSKVILKFPPNLEKNKTIENTIFYNDNFQNSNNNIGCSPFGCNQEKNNECLIM